MQSLIGHQLNHYTITDKLGEGGMGVVYLAEDASLGRRVALKVLPESAAGDDALLERLKREARVIANLNHPNIVTLHAVEKETLEDGEGRTFLVMELVEGETLTQHIPVDGLTLESFFEIAIPLADAMATAHDAGISHRDIKPSNILITQQGWVKVLDFGLAKQLAPGSGNNEEDITQVLGDQLTTEGSVMGTVPYMAPEQLIGKPGGPAADVFSIGIVFYQMLTGKHPFRSGGSSAEVVSAILRDHPRPLDELKIEIPNHLGRILRRCLEKDPDRRYQQAIELKNELLGLRGEVTSGSWRPLSDGYSGGFSNAGATDSRTAAVQDATSRLPAFVAGFPGGVKGVVGAAAALLALLIVSVVSMNRSTPPIEGTEESPIVAPERSLPADAVTLAVLPIEDLGSGQDDSFARALTSEISAALTALDGLNVVAQSSVAQVVGESPRVISKSLGVNHLLSGSIAWDGGQAEGQPRKARLNLRLVHADSELQVWTDSWTRDIDSTLAAQTEIASRVAAGLGEMLLGILPEMDVQLPEPEEEIARVEPPPERPSSSAATEATPSSQPNRPESTTPGVSHNENESAAVGLATKTEEVPAPGQSQIRVEFHSKIPEGIVTIYSGSRAILRQDFSFSPEEESSFSDTVRFEDQGEALRVYVVPKGEAARYRSFDLDGDRETRLVLRVDRDGDFSGKLHKGG